MRPYGLREQGYYKDIRIKYKGFHASCAKCFLWSIITTARSVPIINAYDDNSSSNITRGVVRNYFLRFDKVSKSTSPAIPGDARTRYTKHV